METAIENKKYQVVFSDGKKGLSGDWPIAIEREQQTNDLLPAKVSTVVDPIFNYDVTNNLYGRIMTLVEATTDPVRLKAVKDVFSKEIRDWQQDVYTSAREIADGGGSSSNIYNGNK